MRKSGTAWVVGLGVVLSLGAVLAGCARPSATPAPEDALRVLANVREGYNASDAESFCQDFAPIMFTRGFTKAAYLDVVKGLQRKLGQWVSEVYLGEKDGVYTWRASFEKGRAKVVLVLDDEWKVTGLWFR